MIAPTVQSIDTSNLSRAVEIAQGYSDRTPERAVSTAGFYVARQTTRETHRATVSGIDSQLGVVSEVVLSTRGKRKGLPLKKKKTKFPPLGGDLTVADEIILSRMWPGSVANILENNRWKTDRSIYGTGAAFLQNIRLAAKKMVAGKHSSIAFIASTARAIVKQLEPYVPTLYRRDAPPDDPEVARAQRSSVTPKGMATVIASGMSATMKGEMLAGVGGVPANLNEPHNAAMMEYIPPVLQNAVDTEARKSMDYVARKELKELEGKFRQTGTVIT